MFTVTWIQANKIETISTPKITAACRVYMAMRKAGYTARLWRSDSKGKSLIF